MTLVRDDENFHHPPANVQPPSSDQSTIQSDDISEILDMDSDGKSTFSVSNDVEIFLDPSTEEDLSATVDMVLDLDKSSKFQGRYIIALEIPPFFLHGYPLITI